MKAIVQRAYGEPEGVLSLRDIDPPTIKDLNKPCQSYRLCGRSPIPLGQSLANRYISSGTNVSATHTVSVNSRYTIAAGDAAQAGSHQAFGTKSISNRSIVVERAMYWGTDGGHVTPGIRG